MHPVPPLLSFLVTLLMCACAAPPALPPAATTALDRELSALVADPQAPVVAVAALAVRDGRVAYSGAFGHRHLGDPSAGQPPLPLTDRTLVRVASISKLVVTLGVMRLVEQGRLALDDDVSTLLGWRLRHPQFPDRPITLRLLLSHRSGLSDNGESYAFDAGTRLQDVLGRPGPHWQPDHEPGARFQYVNLNFGVVATVMERATGERFDRLMQRLVLQPLGVRGGFEAADFPPADQADIATQYRKRRTVDRREVWNPQGPWVVQVDDFRQRPPQPTAGLQGYVPGTNGTLFGPQGRLRISLHDLGVVMQMLLDQGRHQGQAFLQPATVALMASEQWRLSAARDNGAPDRDWAVSWGLGVQRFTETSGPGRGDRLVEGGGFSGWGHLGDAYGAMAVFALDPATRRGLVVLVLGPGVDPATNPSRWSALYRWEEQAATAVFQHALR